jgi:hypothetical protein
VTRLARRSTLVAAAVAALALSANAGAQVGHEPQESPFRDVYPRHEITAYGGWFLPRRDPAGVAPQGGPLGGMRYEFYAGGPAFFYARLGASATHRDVLDPTRAQADRNVGEERGPLVAGDVGVSLSLTGRRTWHGLMPVLSAGAGAVSDLRTGTDIGGFSFGTRFALTAGAGVRLIVSERFQLRADASDYVYRINYPLTYYVTGPDDTEVLPARQARSLWTHNVGLSLGVGYLIGR